MTTHHKPDEEGNYKDEELYSHLITGECSECSAAGFRLNEVLAQHKKISNNLLVRAILGDFASWEYRVERDSDDPDRERLWKGCSPDQAAAYIEHGGYEARVTIAWANLKEG